MSIQTNEHHLRREERHHRIPKAHIGVTCPVFSLNPFEARTDFPKLAVRWEIARDITSPARAQNLATGFIPQEKGGANQYFTDAARQVLVGVIESFIRHSGSDWTFSDLIYAALSQDRITELLRRDSPGPGQDVLDGFFGDDRTSYQVFTTICSRISTYTVQLPHCGNEPEKALSIRDWLQENGSILLLGANATAKTSLDAINEQSLSSDDRRNRRAVEFIDSENLGLD